MDPKDITTPPAAPPTPAESLPNGNGSSDTVKLAQEVGSLKTKAEDLEKYKSNVDPLLNTIWSDPEVYRVVEAAHSKRLGIPSKTEVKADEGSDKPSAPLVPSTPTPPSAVEVDNRNALITQSVKDWESRNGVDKLNEEQKKDMNTKVLSELKNMLDPNDSGKTGAQILEGISVTRIPGLLDRAYKLATLEDTIAAAKKTAEDDYATGAGGVIGSIPSGSVNSEEITLTPIQKETARKMHVSDEDYLKNLKEIAKNRNSVY